MRSVWPSRTEESTNRTEQKSGGVSDLIRRLEPGDHVGGKTENYNPRKAEIAEDQGNRTQHPEPEAQKNTMIQWPRWPGAADVRDCDLVLDRLKCRCGMPCHLRDNIEKEKKMQIPATHRRVWACRRHRIAVAYEENTPCHHAGQGGNQQRRVHRPFDASDVACAIEGPKRTIPLGGPAWISGRR